MKTNPKKELRSPPLTAKDRSQSTAVKKAATAAKADNKSVATVHRKGGEIEEEYT